MSNKLRLRCEAVVTSGFTLVELLVVISIIGVLASLAIISFTGTQKQARDTQRKSDIHQYQNSLEVFANRNNGLYASRVSSSGESASSVLCADLELTGCPEDPRNADDPTFVYQYQSDGSGAGELDATQYVLWARLENKSNFWVVCSNGQTGETPQSGWTNPSGGTCPI